MLIPAPQTSGSLAWEGRAAFYLGGRLRGAGESCQAGDVDLWALRGAWEKAPITPFRPLVAPGPVAIRWDAVSGATGYEARYSGSVFFKGSATRCVVPAYAGGAVEVRSMGTVNSAWAAASGLPSVAGDTLALGFDADDLTVTGDCPEAYAVATSWGAGRPGSLGTVRYLGAAADGASIALPPSAHIDSGLVIGFPLRDWRYPSGEVQVIRLARVEGDLAAVAASAVSFRARQNGPAVTGGSPAAPDPEAEA